LNDPENYNDAGRNAYSAGASGDAGTNAPSNDPNASSTAYDVNSL